MTRLVLLIAATWMLAAATPPPATLAPYVKDGRFDPGDYGWMRGRFDDASAADQALSNSVQSWLTRCMAAEAERVKAELVTLGIPRPKIMPQPMQDILCSGVAIADIDTRPWPSFAAFTADLHTARPIASAYVWATEIAVDEGGPRGATLADTLLARPLGEQMLRRALGWGQGAADAAPSLTPTVRAIVLSQIGQAVDHSDRVNTAYLKKIVAEQGWPRASVVGEHASDAAWLMAQHADADPAFQLKVLRMMAPMVANADVSPRNYAYLYDRVMLKVAGTQRYATQATCKGGQRVAQPLEDAGAVDRLRASVGLDSMAGYIAMMNTRFGPCPPEAVGSTSINR